MYPKHIAKIPDTTRAVAPYNFVELPDQVIETEAGSRLVTQDRYDAGLNTGSINCTLTTSSPLFIRAGLTTEGFQKGQESKDLADFYYTNPVSKKPVLPGSSLRGMLRSLVEIVSYSKISKVSDQQRFFFRAVAAPTDDSIGNLYKSTLSQTGVKAGYLQNKDNQWFIKPAKSIEGNTFVWVKDSAAKESIAHFTSMKENDYIPQYVSNVSFGDIFTKNYRKFAGKISNSPDAHQYVGVLVSSGNMVETSQDAAQTPRSNHCLVREPDPDITIPIDEDAVWHYCNSLTEFQRQEPPFSDDSGVLKPGRCIFYCEPSTGKSITLFGQSPNFRIPYSFKGNGEAASAADFVPESLKSADIVDIAESIFGYVRDEKRADSQKQARRGMVSFSDGVCQETDLTDLFMTDADGRVPKILASPKPTTFQHYLVQTSAEKPKLKHYASQPETETVIRGHKLYWHQGSSPDIWHPTPDDAPETQITRIRPIKHSKDFKFKIEFENLSSTELGALLWVLDIAQKDEYRLSLGMGKPLGMGAVKVDHEVYLSDRTQRYSTLFDEEGGWAQANRSILGNEAEEEHIQTFERYVLTELGESGKSKLKQLRRIKMLLAMLKWNESLSKEERDQRRYMEIERDRKNIHVIGQPVKPRDKTVNEYSHRPVLPTPLQIAQDSTQPKDWSVGMVFEAIVLEKTKKGSKVKYDIFDEIYPEKEPKAFDKIPESGAVMVQIKSLKEDGRINHVKFIGMPEQRAH